ncbi:MAG: carbohydrate binding domain-containing protein [Planctomycetes bacterium]|jgi:hypothetical protein|nr:carbohydrate binding domain-containing protein [Planctomycetota bacterium]
MRVFPSGVVSFGAAVLVTILASAFDLRAQESASRAVEHAVPTLPQSCYFVIPAREKLPEGKAYSLLVVLPGGTGTRDFLPFVENGILGEAPADCVGVLVTAVKWQEDQRIVWPTAASKVAGMQYTTEDYVRAVVAAVEKELPIDPKRRAVLAWSSSGPGVYPLLVAKDGPFSHAYVAMSIWPGKVLGDLAAVKGRRIQLDQSPDDKVTQFSHAQKAYEALTKAGALVQVASYTGGHGWLDAPLPRLRKGLEWLFGDKPAQAPKWPGAAAKGKPAKDGNLLANGDFEQGVEGWNLLDNSKRLKVEATKDGRKGGKQALHVQKTGGPPLDLVTQEVPLDGVSSIEVQLWCKSAGCKNAWIKVWLYGDDDKPLREDVDLLRVPADGDWQQVQKSWDATGATRAVVQIILVMGGDLWLDDVVVKASK